MVSTNSANNIITHDTNPPHGGHFTWLQRWVQDQKIRTAIDIGGHEGLWTRAWHKKAKHIITFEPNQSVLPTLKHNTSHMQNMTLHEVALGDKECKVSMEYVDHPGTYHVKDFEGQIPVKTLDSYDLTNVDVIKIDVEGFEVPVIEGARETILYNKPWIQIEANHTGERYGRPKMTILDALRKLGMKRRAKEWPDQIWSF